MNKKFQIFISSTYTDLHDERQAAVEAILKSGHIPAGMELFAAGNESQMDTIRRWIDESDIYMLILGSRYGSIEPKTGLSYIECEYDYATSVEIPLFSLVCSDNILETVKPSDIRKQKYKTFRKRVLSKMCSYYDNCKDIKLGIYESIRNIDDNNGLIGWVPSADSQNTKKLVSSISQFDKRENEKEITIETLADYLDQRYRTILRPDQPPYQPFYADRFYALLKELTEAGYPTIGQLHEALSESEEAFIEWRQDEVGPGISNPPDQIGIATMSLQIYDCNFYCIRREGAERSSEVDWMEEYKAYHPLIKDGPIPCRFK